MASLRKSNSLELGSAIVWKRSAGSHGLEAERRALAFLGSVGVRERGFLVADLVASSGNDSAIAMCRIHGVRVHEFLLDLQRSRLENNWSAAHDAKVRPLVLSSCAKQLFLFQGHDLQLGLRTALGECLRPYPYFERVMEGIEYLVQVSGRPTSLLKDCAELVSQLARCVVAGPSVLFRDAIPKNFLLSDAPAPRVIASRGSHLEVGLGQYYPDVRLSRREDLVVFNVDFQQVSEIVGRMDDWSQLAISEAAGFPSVEVGWNWAAALAAVRKGDEVRRRNEFYATACLRSIRAMARRCFYYRERQVEYGERYGAESRFYYAQLLRELSEEIGRLVGIEVGERVGMIADMCDICVDS